jgi:hypothetical protein
LSTSVASISIGSSSKATGVNALAFGYQTESGESYTIAIRTNSKTTASCAISIGYCAQILHQNSIAIGALVSSTAANTTRIGNSSVTSVQFGDLVISWTSTKITFTNGSNSGFLTLESSYTSLVLIFKIS